MQNNLYRKIKQLVDRKYELKRLGGIIKFDKTKRAEYEQYCIQYQQIENTLDYIIKNCVISAQKVAEIISASRGVPYALKIFRETTVHDDKTIYTGDFLACYLSNKNKYFNYDEGGERFRGLTGNGEKRYVNYPLPKEKFKDLRALLGETDSFVLATAREQTFIPVLPPSDYLEKSNFIKLFVYGYVDTFVSDNFQRLIKNDLIQYLEGIDADKFLNGEDTQSEIT